MPPPPERDPGELERIVTAASFWDHTQAHLARITLESAGIDCAVADENITWANPLYVGLVGGLKVLVRESDLAEARRVLDETMHDGDDGTEPQETSPRDEHPIELQGDLPRCPECGAEDVTYEKMSKWAFFFGLLMLGIPFLYPSRTWRCFECGHQWKLDEQSISPPTEAP